MGSTQLFGAWLAALAECVQELRERVLPRSAALTTISWLVLVRANHPGRQPLTMRWEATLLAAAYWLPTSSSASLHRSNRVYASSCSPLPCRNSWRRG